MTSFNTPPTAPDLIPVYRDVFQTMPGKDPLLYLETGQQPTVPSRGHFLHAQVEPDGDFVLDIYPYADNDISFERRGDGLFIARLLHTVETGVIVGAGAPVGNADADRWVNGVLADGRDIRSCRPPLSEMAVTVGLKRAMGKHTLIGLGIIGDHPATLEVGIEHLAEKLGLSTADQMTVVERVQDQVCGFWNRHAE